MTIKIGITERGDAGLDFSWYNKRNNYDGLILITKKLSDEFIEKAMNTNCIVHATITGLGGTIYEPNVPKLDESSYYFNNLIECIGNERVVLRIDPIIPTERGVEKSLNVYNKLYKENLEDYQSRVRISFMDNYPHVKQRFIKAGLNPLPYNFHAPLELRKEILKLFPNAEVCGEPGIKSVGCVSEKDLEILSIKIPKNVVKSFQRIECQCLSVKREIFNEIKQCLNKCLYCYWK